MTTEATATPAKPEVENDDEAKSSDKTLAKVDKGDYILFLTEIKDGVNKGFQFWGKSYKTLKGALAHFTELSQKGKSGEDLILGLINSALDFRMRSRANAKLTPKKDLTPADRAAFLETKKNNLKDEEGRVAITQDDAEKYVPGEREVSALSGLLNQKTELLKVIKTLKEAGKKDEARIQVQKYVDIVKAIEAKQQEEQNAILAELAEDAA